MVAYDEIIRRWSKAVQGEPTGLTYSPKDSRVYGSGDRLFSYGSHFEMARPIRDGKGQRTGVLGDRRPVVGWLLNGDTYSVSTSRHQADARSVLRRTGLPLLILPHRALAAAGITDLTSIRPVSIDEEWTEKVRDRVYQTERPSSGWDWEEMQPGVWECDRYVHHLGESLITADVPYSTNRPCRACGTFGRRPGIAGRRLQDEWIDSIACPVCRGRGRVVVQHTRRAYFLSGFDRNETRPSYFFCELPRGAKPTTVAEAYEALKPEAVRVAEQLGRAVKRQGDVFAVPVEVSTRALAKEAVRREKSGFVLGVNHRATEVIVTNDGLTFARGTLTHDPGQWRRPDHKRVPMTRGWNLIVKNTVPVSR